MVEVNPIKITENVYYSLDINQCNLYIRLDVAEEMILVPTWSFTSVEAGTKYAENIQHMLDAAKSDQNSFIKWHHDVQRDCFFITFESSFKPIKKLKHVIALGLGVLCGFFLGKRLIANSH